MDPGRTGSIPTLTRFDTDAGSITSHDQNSNFNPDCMMREFTLMALIFPKVLGLETLLAGFAKFG